MQLFFSYITVQCRYI